MVMECVNRKEKRKAQKKDKRKQRRKELAEKLKEEEEALLNDPEEQRRVQMEEEAEKLRIEREMKEFEERERLFLEELARRKAQEEEEERRRAIEEEEEERSKQIKAGGENEENDDEEWEYVEEGPPEIIWQGNEIIVKKNRVRVKKKDVEHVAVKEDPSRPTSNPFPPESEELDEYNNGSTTSVQGLLDSVAQQNPNFGTEQDKAHCPFHIKTGACRFGLRCSRIHFYPDKSCTLLMKNMYNGPGLAWEQDEGLECTDEEVENSYEEFYEDVHTEFLKFGEIVNFKVCRNSSSHLRGNVYVHYKSLDSAVLAYNSINGRYFAGKQITCEFVSVTRWKVAICGEYMKSRLKTCSRGTTCNFIHCFRNPGGDYEWADWDKPPPKYWIKKMAALFGYSDESVYNRQSECEDSEHIRNSSKTLTADLDRHYERSQSRERRRSHSRDNRSSRSHKEHDVRRREQRKQTKDIDEHRREEKGYRSNHHDIDEHRREEERGYRSNHHDIDEHRREEVRGYRSNHHDIGEHRREEERGYRSNHHDIDENRREEERGYRTNHHDSSATRPRRSWSDRSESHDHHDHRKCRSSSTDSGADLSSWKREGDAELRHTRKKTRHAKKASEFLNDDDDNVRGYRRTNEDSDSDCGYDLEDIDERGRWEPDREASREFHRKRLASSERKASDYSSKGHKKKHRSHHHRSDKGNA